ncbi:hypothetical protein TWF106_005858 [Orbilia oligospora]|uniref:Uncharacterized protein n=1 Tax=Orbilia oligospora TaxID=2813651 RepID=A0A7C8UPQ6_ORBOL|nr:hypothetical protein TWF788_009791 [Orbilia oligospora]KAF3209734.1 hypothetical protein TWF679_007273 [Orbilia oligospora]KAF3222080.1 hypothetical protein TWF106_005858 [Orbilia oligospora]KAF3227779.1 hypothetical protein TWF191_003299 [Orbilia oligospora]
MRIQSKPLLWQAGVLAALLFFKGIEAGVAAVTEQDLGGYLKLIKRVNDDGVPEIHMDLHERWHNDEIGQALRKRQESGIEKNENAYAFLPVPSTEERDMFKDSFKWVCGSANNKISSVQELTGAAMTIMSKSGHYEIEGWSTPGTISLGNQATDPKKYQDEVPVHCLGEAGKTSIVMSPVKSGVEFKYGISLSRALIGRCINTMIYICGYDLSESVGNFQFNPKQNHLDFVQIQTVAKPCERWVDPLCKSGDDESKAECLATKLLLGIPWSKTLPTPTKPAKKKK